jgi:ligand-binding sensor domain-containing protein
MDISSLDYSYQTVDDGLISNSINDIAVDSAGNILVATDLGLAKYNGTKWYCYPVEISRDSHDIVCVVAGNDGTVWAGTSEGLLKYVGNTCTRYTTEIGLKSNIINDLCIQDNGNLLIGTHDGFAIFDKNGKLISYDTLQNGTYIGDIDCIEQENDTTIWIAGGNQVFLYDGDGLLRKAKAPDSVYNSELNSIVIQNDGTKWLGFEFNWRGDYGGLYKENKGIWSKYTRGAGTFGNSILALHVDRNGALWIGAQNGLVDQGDKEQYGLVRYKDSKWDTVLIRSTFGNYGAYAIDIDHNNVKWFASVRGFSGFNGKDWQYYNVDDWLLSNNTSIDDIKIGSDNTIWLINNGYGMSYNGKIWANIEGMPSTGGNNLRNVELTQDGSLWYGSESGLLRYNGTKWVEFTTKNGLSGNNIHSLTGVKDGGIWVGTNNGMTYIKGDSCTSYDTSDGLVSSDVRDIDVDVAGRVWIATGKGIEMFDGAKWTTFGTAQGLPNSYVSSIAIDSNFRIWAGFHETEWSVANGGVAVYDGGKWKSFDTTDFKFLKSVTDIAVDHNNVIWIATQYSGIIKFDENAIKLPETLRSYHVLKRDHNNEFFEVSAKNDIMDILFYSNKDAIVEIDVLNLSGDLIAKVCSARFNTGNHRLHYNVKGLPSGMYITSMHSPNLSVTARLFYIHK